MKYAAFDIVMLGPALGGKIYAIVSVEAARPNAPYIAVRLDRGPLTKTYRLDDGLILAKIGTLDAAALKLNPADIDLPAPPDWELGQSYAGLMAQRAETEGERRRWGMLALLRPGDPVPLCRWTRYGEQVEVHRFREVLPSGQRYHFTAMNAQGKLYRWTLESLPDSAFHRDQDDRDRVEMPGCQEPLSSRNGS